MIINNNSIKINSPITTPLKVVNHVTGGDGTIQVSPTSNNYETSIAFYRNADKSNGGSGDIYIYTYIYIYWSVLILTNNNENLVYIHQVMVIVYKLMRWQM